MKANKINKPWGYEELIELNDRYCLKKLYMKKIIDVAYNITKKKLKQFLYLRAF